ncbi:MAG: S8 family serine peptidase [Phycisphaerae bacterium]
MSSEYAHAPRRALPTALLLSASFIGLLAAASPLHGEIRWRSGVTPPMPAATAEQVATTVRGLVPPGETRHIVIQFTEPLDRASRKTLEAAGVALLAPLGDDAFFATVSDASLDMDALASIATLRAAQAIQRNLRLHPVLTAGNVPAYAVVGRTPDEGGAPVEDRVAVYALFHPDVKLADAVALVRMLGAEVRSELFTVNALVLELPRSKLDVLADRDEVQWIEPPLPPMDVVNDSNRVVTQADAVQGNPYKLDGTGVTVLVYDGGTGLASHSDFGGRLTARDASGLSDHSTHVAGTIGGDGAASGGTFRGMAPNVIIESYGFEYDGSGTFLYTNPGDIQTDYNQAINTFGADIANNSIGTNTESNGFDCAFQGDYGVTAQLIDSIVRGSLGAPFRIVWANGNERQGTRCNVEGFGSYYSTAPPACAKNHITVGALNSNDDSMTSFSSWGPCDDGRLKPDISAPGCESGNDGGVTSTSSAGGYTVKCGTSMAAPTVTGLSSLLLGDFRVQFPGAPDFRNSTLKVLLAHNAQDRGNAGPDYQFGYGSVRIKDTIDFMRTGNFLEDQVDQGTTFSILVTVNPGDPQLRVTLAWDDPPGTPNVSPALINDLDLRVFDPASAQHFPWTLDPLNPGAPAVQTQADHINNIEQVLVNAPTPGVWTVEVVGFNVPSGPQVFSIAASPQLVACSPTGVVGLDRSAYACNDTAEIKVIDCDLNTSDTVTDSVTVSIASGAEPGGESVLLTETSPETADFRGIIPISDVDAAGVLLVTPGDTVTATYIDADDGQGGVNVVVTAAAGIDCTGPVISNVQLAQVSANSATVTFTTDEPAVGTVRHGLSCGVLGQSATESGSGTNHTVVLTGLTDGSNVFFVVDAADLQNNVSTDDNGGACYSFTTPAIVFDFPLDADPGWTTAGQWAFGQPTGGGSNNGDPTGGNTGTNVYGYNLAGDYTDNLPATYLTTTAIDCSGLTNVNLRFWRWLGVESNSSFDEATVEASNNGTTWTVLWRATDTFGAVADTSWQFQEFDISALADNQPTVFIRWGMGPTDTSVTYPGWNVDDVQIIANQQPLAIGFPNGAPDFLAPGVPNEFDVDIQDRTETLVPGTATLHYRYGAGAFQTAPLTALGGTLFRATLPPAVCTDAPEFYVSAQGSGGSTVTNPAAAPLNTITATVGIQIVAIDDNFETDMGWTAVNLGATSGDWERGVPVNDSGWDYDPVSDADGSGQCYLTQNVIGNTDVDNGAVQLISPALDLSGGGITIEYDYYLRLTDTAGGVDRLLVEIDGNNGAGPWIEIARHDTDGGLTWRHHVITQADLDAAGVTLTSTMMLRFTANDANPQSINESGLDAFRVSGFTCDFTPAPCPTVPGDMDGNSIVDGRDVQGFVGAMLGGFDPCADVAAPFSVLDPADTLAFVNLLITP